MTLTNRLLSFFRRPPAPTEPGAASVASVPEPIVFTPSSFTLENQPVNSLIIAHSDTEIPLPYWLKDEESLRDEGVLFGLSDALPDEKITEIRSYFARKAALLEQTIEEHTEKIGELNLFIEQRENRIAELQKQSATLRESQPATHSLLRTLASLVLSVMMCVGTFYLIDQTLRPMFPNRWIAVGVFLAGMFNLFGRTSFFYEENTRLTSRRVVEELALPLAAALFVMAQAWQTQSGWQAIALFVFVFFLFLLAGKLLLSTLTALQTDADTIRQNRQLTIDKRQDLPRWQAERDQCSREVDAIRVQKWPIVTALNQSQTNLTRLNTQRDQLVNLFLSEFELARSLRHQLKSVMSYER